MKTTSSVVVWPRHDRVSQVACLYEQLSLVSPLLNWPGAELSPRAGLWFRFIDSVLDYYILDF